MKYEKEIAESYKDLSKILATIGSGLFIAAGIGATFFSSSIRSALTMINQGYELSVENSTAIAQSNTTKLLQEGASHSIQSANSSLQMMFFLFNEGVLISCFSVYFWYKAHRIVEGRGQKIRLRLPALYFILGSISLLLASATI